MSLDNWLESKEEWMDLQSVVCVKSRRTRRGKTTEETRYYISSLASHAAQHGEVIRQHWAVQNKLHWHLDVTFNEDKCKIRAKNGPENFSLLKRIALNVIKADKTEQSGVEAKRLMAGWKPSYRLRLLGIK
jgi:predicted transposase YbfD/YdcC